ncbi:MAG TPA: 30S ribosomal protein S17e [Candidatus Aenigmarchaeota archaeon]|nr:MAG: 30S ribosomal protein S17e [Candidatus Aenigmarchaeota archaeon]HDD46443.1 30S ribosomal protein S17e [Candidatus Aenigmarchaeota archaeon]
MGRIKTVLIKRLGNEIVKRYKEKLSDDFEKNKKIVENIIKIKSKKMRNIIVGYITREMKLLKRKEVVGGGIIKGPRKTISR